MLIFLSIILLISFVNAQETSSEDQGFFSKLISIFTGDSAEEGETAADIFKEWRGQQK